jgi:hypothetical protein
MAIRRDNLPAILDLISDLIIMAERDNLHDTVRALILARLEAERNLKDETRH